MQAADAGIAAEADEFDHAVTERVRGAGTAWGLPPQDLFTDSHNLARVDLALDRLVAQYLGEYLDRIISWHW